MNEEPTVFVVDDDEDFCEALRWLLESDGLAVEAHHSAESYLESFDPRRPGVLLLDVRMASMSGLELHRILIERGFGIPVIFLTGHGDVPMAVESVKRGAVDFLQKPVRDQVLIDRIRAAIDIDTRRRAAAEAQQEIRDRFATLTPREREVMKLIVAGHPNKRIAAMLCVSEKTIEVHRKHVMSKMGVHSAVELVRVVVAIEQSEPDS